MQPMEQRFFICNLGDYDYDEDDYEDSDYDIIEKD